MCAVVFVFTENGIITRIISNKTPSSNTKYTLCFGERKSKGVDFKSKCINYYTIIITCVAFIAFHLHLILFMWIFSLLLACYGLLVCAVLNSPNSSMHTELFKLRKYSLNFHSLCKQYAFTWL